MRAKYAAYIRTGIILAQGKLSRDDLRASDVDDQMLVLSAYWRTQDRMRMPRKEDYCARHDWLLAKDCTECKTEIAVAS